MALGAHGSRFKAYWKEESAEGTAPSGNWDQFPCMSLAIGAAPGLQSDSVLSANARRNAADPYQTVARVEGTARVPLETVHFGWWCNMLFGDPSTTGSGPYTHVFKSGGTTLPTRSIEKAFPDITRYEVASGVRANSLSVEIGPDGAAMAEIGLLCLSEVLASSSAAGTPVVTAFSRFNRTQGVIEYDGGTLAGVTGGTLRFANGMQAVPTVGAGLGIGGVDMGEATGGGSITLRFANHTLEGYARAATPKALTWTVEIDADTFIEFHFPRMFLEPTSAPVEGPGGITRSYNFIAADDSSDASLLRVTIKNGVASYA
jgi:hypothetical protein